MVEPILSGPGEPPLRRPLLGYAMVLAATCMWGINGTVSKAILGAGLSSPRLTEVRSTGAAVALAVALAVTQPWRLRVRRNELLFLVAFGIFGLALVQWFYFFAIHRLQIGIALLIQYLAPVLIALWARFVMAEPVRRRIWAALILSLGGALRHISATRVGVTAMFEPVAGALVAYAWLGESLSAVQLTGGAIVLAGILLAQTAR